MTKYPYLRLRRPNPFVGMKLVGLITRDFGPILGNGNFQHALDVLRITAALAPLVFIAERRINAPVNEHPERASRHQAMRSSCVSSSRATTQFGLPLSGSEKESCLDAPAPRKPRQATPLPKN